MTTTVYNRKLSTRQVEQLRALLKAQGEGRPWITVWRGSHQWRTCESLARRGLVAGPCSDDPAGSSTCCITFDGVQALAAAEAAGRIPTDPLH